MEIFIAISYVRISTSVRVRCMPGASLLSGKRKKKVNLFFDGHLPPSPGIYLRR